MSERLSVMVNPVRSYKYVFLGESSVGKTSLLTRFMYNEFSQSYEDTLGLDFSTKTVFVEGRTFRLNIWDTAGQDKFRLLIFPHIRDCNIAVVVYDITNIVSFQQTSKWIDLVRKERGKNISIMLVGTKADLLDQRIVSTEKGIKQAKKCKVKFAEVSATTSLNIKDLFMKTIKSLELEEVEKPRVQEVNIDLEVVDLKLINKNRQLQISVLVIASMLFLSACFTTYTACD